MKFASLAILAATMMPLVRSHSTEIRHCILSTGDLRIYVEHWHGTSAPAFHDTMNIRDDNAPGQPVTSLNPSGFVHDIKNKMTDLPGCEYTVQDTNAECGGMGDYEHWVYYDFPAVLGIPVTYTILAGNSAMLTEGCPELLPTTISGVLKIPTADDIAKAKKAVANGDPHFSTWSGDTYDFHGGCDLVLFENKHFLNGKGMSVHARTKINTWWSYIESAAVRIGDHTLEVVGGESNNFWLNGVPGTPGMDSFEAHFDDHLLTFHRINAHQMRYRIDLGYGDAIAIETYKDFVRVDMQAKNPRKFEGSKGLMGSYPLGAKIGRNGTVIEDPDRFGNEWQVLESEPKLFHVESGPQHPAKCEMPSATASRRNLGESRVSKEAAETACSDIDDKVEQDHCVADVLAVGDLDIADSYKYSSKSASAF